MSVVALDIGTSRIKALLAGWDGRLRGVRSARTPTVAGADGRLAFPAEAVEAEAAALVAGIGAEHADDPVDTLVFSCLGTAMVPLDRAGRALGPALAPSDPRPAAGPPVVDRLALSAETLFDLTGQDPRLPSFLLHWLWWRETEPDLMRRLHRFRSLRGYIVEGLCHADAEDPSWASRTMLMDLATDAWSEAVLGAGGLPADALPAILPATSAWTADEAAGARFGLAPGARVVLGAMDNCCAFLGASEAGEHRLVNIAGTYEHLAGVGGLDLVRPAVRAVGGLVHRYPLDGLYLGYSRVALGPLLDAIEAAAGEPLERLMDEVAAAPTGARVGLDPGEVADALRAASPPGRVLQGVLESCAALLGRFAAAWSDGGGAIDRIVAVGGGAAWPRVLQLKAGVLGRPVCTVRLDEAAGLGALRLAAVAVAGASPEEACALFPNPVARTWAPAGPPGTPG